MANASLEILLRENRRPILVEFDPPRNESPHAFIAGARELYEAGADVITIADCPIGRASIDACMLAAKLKREYGIETLPHMACRDRNLNAAKALLMGLAMEGIGQVLLVTGDPVSHEDREQVKGVFQMSSRTLAKSIVELTEQGRLQPFFLCGALNVNARNFEIELERAQRKEQCGISAFLTQPVSSQRAADNLGLARRELKGALLGGLFPIVSYKNACFLKNEVAGMEIGDDLLAAYEGLDREAGEALGRKYCVDMAKAIRNSVNGFYIMTPFRRVALVKGIISDLKQL